jgi:glycosyltransferase 2 family protein
MVNSPADFGLSGPDLLNKFFKSQLLRWSITAALLATALSKLSAAQIGEITNPRGAILLVAALVTILVALALNALRWLLIAQALDLRFTWRGASRWILIGQFFNQIFPSSIGGDIVRGAMAGHETGDLPAAAVSIALDRLIGLFALLIFLALGQMLAIRSANLSFSNLIILAAAVAGVAAAAYILVNKGVGPHVRTRLHRAVMRFLRDTHLLLAQTTTSIVALVLSLALQAINLGQIALIANQLGASLSVLDTLFVLPTVLLVSNLPISISGWGVRETGLAVGFAAIGQSASIGVATSLIFGLASLLSALPGAIAWIFSQRKDRPVDTLSGLREST